MIKILKLAVLLLFVSLGSLAYGQDIPAVTSPTPYQGAFSLPDIPGNLNFSASLTEGIRTGYYGTGGPAYLTSVSGNAGYLSNSTRNPFRLTFSGGYSYVTTGKQSSPFVNLTLSQTLASRNWTLMLNNAFRYLPEAPTTGLSGLANLGDLGQPIPVTGGLDILTPYSQRVINTSSVDVDRKLTGSTDLTGTGSYSFQRFLDPSILGNDYNQVAGQFGVKHRLDALSSFTVSYDFTRFSYINVNFSFISQGGSLQYTRQWTRRFNTDVSAGPQVHSSSNTALGGSSLTFASNLSATYLLERGSINATYVRGVQGGSGVTQGSSADTLRGDLTHRLGEYSNITFDATYARHHQLFVANSFAANTISGGVQASHTISPKFSVYASYIAQHQSARGSITNSGTFSGLNQTFSVGLTYSPRPIHLGH